MKLGLALSGGGVRAAVFHLGVLRRLARDGLLEEVVRVSTVSGGSLLTGLLISRSGKTWPTSTLFLTDVYPEIRQVLTTVDLFSLRAVGWRVLLTQNIRLLRSRAGLLAENICQRWGITEKLRELPDNPLWYINATCLHTGKNWRFSKREMGDWQFGRHYEPPFRVADAVAASAAVPYAIGSLTLHVPYFGWYRTHPATRQPIEKRDPPTTIVRLWDGGAYENLGLEALFKPGQGLLGCDFLLCSDASGPLSTGHSSPLANLIQGKLGAPRLFEVAGDQIRSLRSRMFVGAVERGMIRGALVRMGNSVRDIDIKADRRNSTRDYDKFQPDQEVARALRYPTDLRAIPEQDFDRLARHGFEVADATLTTYSPTSFQKSAAWTS